MKDKLEQVRIIWVMFLYIIYVYRCVTIKNIVPPNYPEIDASELLYVVIVSTRRLQDSSFTIQ